MATISLVDIGAVADDGTGDALRVAFNKINQSLQSINNELGSLSFLSASDLIRSAINVNCDGTTSQQINYTSAFTANAAINIIDFEGIGIELVSQDANGFVISSLSSGQFHYIATILE